jgi:acetyl esterase/lipase
MTADPTTADPTTATTTTVTDTELGSGVAVRTYLPTTATAGLVWAHGGSFVRGDLDMPEADWVARTLAELGIAVVSVDYRRARADVHFPVPVDDVVTAWAWATGEDGPDTALPWSIGGASAGANLALAAAFRLRDGEREDRPMPMPTSVVLVYPTLHAYQPPGAVGDATDFPPPRILDMYRDYVGTLDEVPPLATPGEVDPAGLPRTLVVAAGNDGLRPSAEGFVRALAAADVEHELDLVTTARHGFLNRPDDEEAAPAVGRIADWLRA